MKKVVGYLVMKDNEVIGATGDEREAMYIARTWKGISYRVETAINPKEDPTTERTVAYDGTL